jgi:serralysin
VQTTIEANGATSLAEFGGHYYLINAAGIGPQLKYAGAAVVVGQFGGWTPIGAEQTASGYEVALKITDVDEYTVWNTDSSGNYVSQATGAVSGSSAALEALEPSFHQDLNGDGVIGLAVTANATLELDGVHSDNVTFESSTGTLKMDSASMFTGQIIGFTGDGTLSGSDQVDLLNMSFGSSIQINSSYDPSTGALSVSNGATVDVLNFIGSYSQDNFKFASDGHGGTIVYDPPATNQTPAFDDGQVHITSDTTINAAGPLDGHHVIVEKGTTLTLDRVTAAVGTFTNNGTVKVADDSTVNIAAAVAGKDNFVFAPNYGQANISHSTLTLGSPQIAHSAFANLDALLTATHYDSNGNAVNRDVPHDTITIENVTMAQMFAHQGDFHLI